MVEGIVMGRRSSGEDDLADSRDIRKSKKKKQSKKVDLCVGPVTTVLGPFLHQAKQGGIRRTVVWSHGGRHHFKQRFIAEWWARMAQQCTSLEIDLNYFECHHGGKRVRWWGFTCQASGDM